MQAGWNRHGHRELAAIARRSFGSCSAKCKVSVNGSDSNTQIANFCPKGLTLGVDRKTLDSTI